MVDSSAPNVNVTTNAFCNKCGWCHFEVTADYVRKWKDEWAEYCKTWTEEQLAMFGIKNRQPPSEDAYLECFRCGNSFKDFSDKGRFPDGSTIQPILRRTETI